MIAPQRARLRHSALNHVAGRAITKPHSVSWLLVLCFRYYIFMQSSTTTSAHITYSQAAEVQSLELLFLISMRADWLFNCTACSLFVLCMSMLPTSLNGRRLFLFYMDDARSHLIAIVQLHIICNYNFQFRPDFHQFVVPFGWCINLKRPILCGMPNGAVSSWNCLYWKCDRKWTAFKMVIWSIVAETGYVRCERDDESLRNKWNSPLTIHMCG